MERLTRELILQYAADGVRNQIGIHPCPNEYPEEIAELEAHLKQLERQLHRLHQQRTS